MNKVKLYGIKKDGTKERVLRIDMGQSSTSIDTDVKERQNSIKFIAFVDDKGKEMDIYRYFNPYRFKEDRCELDTD